MGKTVQNKQKAAKVNHKFVVNCRLPIEDNVLILSDFENYMAQRIKVEGKIGNLGDAVKVAKERDNLVISANIPFSKRYVKYLTKKYLKKQDLREFLRVVSSNKNTYELRYPDVVNDEQE